MAAIRSGSASGKASGLQWTAGRRSSTARWQPTTGTQCECGRCLDSGAGVAKAIAGAEEWYKSAAGQVNAVGQHNYGVCLRGVPRDVVRAPEYFRLPANQSHKPGLSTSARCVETGTGVARDVAKAAEHYRKAKNDGHPSARAGCVGCTS
jgi:TPR repeat protein